jgi:hypothetical protein
MRPTLKRRLKKRTTMRKLRNVRTNKHRRNSRNVILKKTNGVIKMRGGASMDFLINTNTELLHATKEDILNTILDSGVLLTNIERKEMGIVSQGEGNIKRELCHPYKLEGEIPKKCSETYGVYMRLFMYGKRFFNTNVSPFKKEKNYCGLVLSPSCLDGTMWHINTCENNGFIIVDGKTGFGDCDTPAVTIAPQQVIDILPENIKTQIKSIEILTPEMYDEVKETTEVILLNSVSLKHLEKIYFMNPEHMEKYKTRLDGMNIKYELIV